MAISRAPPAAARADRLPVIRHQPPDGAQKSSTDEGGVKGLRRWVIAMALLILAVCGGIFWFNREPNPEPGLTSGQLVYCSDSSIRPSVVRTAIALNYLSDVSTVSAPVKGDVTFDDFGDWVQEDASGFQSSCRASIEAVRIRSGGQSAAPASYNLAPLWGVALGAVLTLLIGEWRASRDVARSKAEALRAALVDVNETAQSYFSVGTRTLVGAPNE